MTTKEAAKIIEDYRKSCIKSANAHIFKDDIEAFSLAIKALKFSEFAGKMLFDDWEQDCNGVFPELSCRRLVDLGIVELKDGKYSLKRGDTDDKVN